MKQRHKMANKMFCEIAFIDCFDYTVKHLITKCQGWGILLRYKRNLLYPSSLQHVNKYKVTGNENHFDVSVNSL